MERLPSDLLAAVQDLHELLQRNSLGGPQRHSLFHDAQQREQDWPAAVLTHGPALELLLRGAGCLLANSLAAAALPLLRELLPGLRRLDEALSGPLADGVLQYYRLLEHELALGLSGNSAARAYYLCGELIALYLDLLCVARPPLHASLGTRVLGLRRRLHQARPPTAPGQGEVAT